MNEFWLQQDKYVRVNQSSIEGFQMNQTLPLSLHFSPISFFKFAMYNQVEDSLKMQSSLGGGMVQSELDEVKVFRNIYVLIKIFQFVENLFGDQPILSWIDYVCFYNSFYF